VPTRQAAAYGSLRSQGRLVETPGTRNFICDSPALAGEADALDRARRVGALAAYTEFALGTPTPGPPPQAGEGEERRDPALIFISDQYRAGPNAEASVKVGSPLINSASRRPVAGPRVKP